MTWHTYLKQPNPKKLTQLKKKKNPPELKLTHPTQIKLTLKLNSNSLPVTNHPTISPLSPLCKIS